MIYSASRSNCAAASPWCSTGKYEELLDILGPAEGGMPFLTAEPATRARLRFHDGAVASSLAVVVRVRRHA